jgi:hypothetical protein
MGRLAVIVLEGVNFNGLVPEPVGDFPNTATTA